MEKFGKKCIKRAITPTILSQIVTKIAQQIDLFVLNDFRSFRILIAAFVFELLNVKVEKFEKTAFKGQ